MIILIHDNELQLEDFEKDFLIMAVLEKQMIIETDVRAIEIITKNKINLNNLFINDAVAGHRGKSACIKTLDKEFISNIFSNYEIIAINEYIPYDENIEITNKLKECCKLLDIMLLDHLIITKDDYFSFADEGLL